MHSAFDPYPTGAAQEMCFGRDEVRCDERETETTHRAGRNCEHRTGLAVERSLAVTSAFVVVTAFPAALLFYGLYLLLCNILSVKIENLRIQDLFNIIGELRVRIILHLCICVGNILFSWNEFRFSDASKCDLKTRIFILIL